MKIKQNVATTPIIATFAIISITGVFMFFDIKNSATKFLHEWLGLAFVIISLLHIMANFGAFKRYFSGAKFGINLGILALSVLVFAFMSFANEGNNKVSKAQMSEVYAKISNLEISKVAEILGTNEHNLEKLENLQNLSLKNGSKSGNLSEKELLNLLLNK